MSKNSLDYSQSGDNSNSIPQSSIFLVWQDWVYTADIRTLILAVHIDIVDVFRPSAEAFSYAEDTVKIGAKVLWLQLGIRSAEAKKMLISQNIEYIENRCTKMEYQKIFLKINPAFPALQD